MPQKPLTLKTIEALVPPRIWGDILERFKAQGIPAVIAGGAPRDFILHRDIKDIDVWVPADSFGSLFNTAREALGDLGEPTFDRQSSREYHNWQPAIMGFVEYELGGWKIQVVGLRIGATEFTPESVLNTFDLGICMAAYTIERGVVISKAFSDDALASTMTIQYPMDNHMFATAHRRYTRLLAKYPGWKFGIAESLTVAESPEEAPEELFPPFNVV